MEQAELLGGDDYRVARENKDYRYHSFAQMGTSLNKFVEFVETHMVIFLETFVYPILKETDKKVVEVHETEFIDQPSS